MEMENDTLFLIKIPHKSLFIFFDVTLFHKPNSSEELVKISWSRGHLQNSSALRMRDSILGTCPLRGEV